MHGLALAKMAAVRRKSERDAKKIGKLTISIMRNGYPKRPRLRKTAEPSAAPLKKPKESTEPEGSAEMGGFPATNLISPSSHTTVTEDPTQVVDEPLEASLHVCVQCNKPTYNEESMWRHLSGSHAVPADQVKDKTLWRELALGDVIAKRSNTSGDPYKCLKCGDTFFSASIVLRHVRVSPEGTLSCKTWFPQGAHLTWHIKDKLIGEVLGITTEASLCQQCGCFLKTRLEAWQHMKKCPKRNLRCHLCKTVVSSNTELREHLDTMHPPNEARSFICDKCAKSFQNNHALNHHRQTVHGKKTLQCPQCPLMFVSIGPLNNHLRLTHSDIRPYKCLHCEKAFKRSEHLKQHSRLHSGEKPFVCSQCDAAFTQRTSLSLHIKNHH